MSDTRKFTMSGSLTRTGVMILVLVLVALVISLFARNLARQSALTELDKQAGYELRRTVASLQAQLEEYESLPHLLAVDPRLQQALQAPNDAAVIEQTNRFLESVNQISQASDTYLMNAEGTTIAASNWRSVKSFVGKNFSYRPYFKSAMEGRGGRYSALGTTSEIRGFYFSFPVSDEDVLIGAVVVKISLADIEQQWASPWGQNAHEVLVTDEMGVVFISTRAEWRFRLTRPLSAEEQARLDRERRYASASLSPIIYEASESEQLVPGDGPRFLRIGDEPTAQRYIQASADMPEVGWQVHVLMPLQRVRQEVSNVLLLSLSMFLVIVLLVMLLVERTRRERSLRQAQEQLEERVRHRTRDLSTANQQLQDEVAERMRTETALKQAQEELVQTAKLALLGQLSASINHELNQPLTALRSYTQNALAFIRRQRYEQVSMNLQEIVELVDHMASIIGQLKVFARKETETIGVVPLSSCLDGALKITEPELKRHAVTLVRDAADDLLVMADLVRLEQVLINLITNAVQAMSDADWQQRQLHLSASSDQDTVSITVSDSGPGISDEVRTHLFEPFYTTKPGSQGLGLGLSISQRIVESLGGSLTAENNPEGGAVFKVTLRRAGATKSIAANTA